MYRVLLIWLLFFPKLGFSVRIRSDVGLTPEQIIKKYGYPFEEHTVETKDGYLLTLHRIPYGVKDNSTEKTRSPVLIMHGLLCSSAVFVNMGPEKALSFLLADAGYDVWLANNRGNTWSRKHINIDPDKEKAKFFNFSFHEIGTLDLPAKIDYILATVKQDSLFYIGHSQGTTTVFVLLSTKPEYNAKIKMAVNLAPVVYFKHAANAILKISGVIYDLLIATVKVFSIFEAIPTNSIAARTLRVVSEIPILREVIVFIFCIIYGFDSPQLDRDFLPVFTTNYPAGASIKQFIHYLQIKQSDQFSFYDYGSEGNYEIYGQKNPPIYNLSQISTPVTLHYSTNDYLGAVEDVKRLAEELPNAQLKLVPLSAFNHMDHLWAIDVVKLLNNDVVSEIKSFT